MRVVLDQPILMLDVHLHAIISLALSTTRQTHVRSLRRKVPIRVVNIVWRVHDIALRQSPLRGTILEDGRIVVGLIGLVALRWEVAVLRLLEDVLVAVAVEHLQSDTVNNQIDVSNSETDVRGLVHVDPGAIGVDAGVGVEEVRVHERPVFLCFFVEPVGIDSDALGYLESCIVNEVP